MKKIFKNLLKQTFPKIYNFYGLKQLYSIRKRHIKNIKENVDDAFFHSSRSLHYLCNVANKIPLTGNPYLKLEIEKFKMMETVFLHTDSIDLFYTLYFRKIRRPFILITADSDTALNQKNFKHIEKILKSDYLIKWFAQNLDFQHEKLDFLPIGIDYHTSNKSIKSQNQILKSVLKTAKPIKNRNYKCYCNWHFFLERGDRQDCFNSVDKNLCFYEPKRVSREISWKNNLEYTFTLSPEGGGIDCHRTYESIILGSIPILKKNSITSYLKHLPVVIVDEWSEINLDFLRKKIVEISNKKFDFTKVFQKYWSSKIYQKKYVLPKMTLEEFRIFLIREL